MRRACTARRLNPGLFILSTIALLLSCGGGGGETSPPAPAPLSYTGQTSKALIDSSNAIEITSEALNGGIGGTVFNRFAALNGANDAMAVRRYHALRTAMILQNAVMDLVNGSSSAVAGRAVQTEQMTVEGACGGQAVGQLQVDDATGHFSGTLTFTDYCDAEATLNGGAAFSGSINLTTQDVEAILLTFHDLAIDYTNESYRFGGTLEITHQADSLTISMDMLLQDSVTGDVFWVDDYTMVVVDYQSYLSMRISGDFYDPHHGYVRVSTQQDLVIYDYDRKPTAGILICTGEDGTAGGPTQARLTCFPSGLYQVEADTDGDGTFDWNSGPLSWEGD